MSSLFLAKFPVNSNHLQVSKCLIFSIVKLFFEINCEFSHIYNEKLI